MQNNGTGSYKTTDKYAKFGPKLTGPLPGPKAKAVGVADTKWLSPSYTRSYPRVAKRGRGIRVEDADGYSLCSYHHHLLIQNFDSTSLLLARRVDHSGTDQYNRSLGDSECCTSQLEIAEGLRKQRRSEGVLSEEV